MPAKAKNQLALDEKLVEDKELEEALDQLEAANNTFAAARIARDRVKTEALGRIEALDLGVDTAVRVGRFRITKTMTKGGHREFDTQAKERVSISLADEE